MKRLIGVLFLSICIIFSLSPITFAQEERISVLVDGLPTNFDVEPIIENGRTLVPFRAIAEDLNVKVEWDGGSQTINATDKGTSIQLQIGSSTAYINEMAVTLDVSPQIINGRTLIPLRFFSEAFNCNVEWIGSRNEVKIISAPAEMKVIGFYALGDTRTSSWTNLFGAPYPEAAKGNTDVVDELAFGWYSMDREGNLLLNSKTGWQRPAGWEAVLTTAYDFNLATEMLIHITNGDGTISSIIANEEAMKNSINSILAEVVMYGGVNLNFESLGLSEKGEALLDEQKRFTRFVRLLSEELHANNKTLTLTIHPPNSAYNGYDYKALGEVADTIIIMAYDYGPKPEPINRVLQAVEMAIAYVPAEKLVLGISAPYETPDSILSKIGIAKRYNLQGIALWRLGLISTDMWDVLKIATR
ncbi:MAG: copper amine oxidase [Desulfitibacter sp. BRH_c19]|nr:MAG: copper amine oxidase [Desulfitibacter sp. BRH_c19]